MLANILPNESFVPFEAEKLARPRLAWRNSELATDFALDEYAFCVRYPGESAMDYLPPKVTLLGERYGGPGVGKNGGGVRCGLINGYQSKGIGKNPLAGVDMDFWHSHGGASLELALRETVWGEVCHLALPYGAARVVAVIETGTFIPYQSHKGRRQAKRALFLREAKSRPAHFMRSLYFKPSEFIQKNFLDDTQRTICCVRTFHDVLEKEYPELCGRGQANDINEFLLEFSHRLARQLAVARAKKILHGGLSPSNLSLDGAWLDFDTITSMSDYGSLIMGGFDVPDFWSDHSELHQTIAESHTYLKKYLDKAISAAIVDLKTALDCFYSELIDASALSFAMLTGYPRNILAQLDRNELRLFYKVIRKIIRKGNETPFYYSPRHVWDMPEKMGDFNLAEIFRHASLATTKEEVRLSTSTRLTDKKLCNEFVELYWNLRRRCESSFKSKESAYIFSALNAQRRNMTVPELYRRNLDQTIEDLCIEEFEPAGVINAILEKAKFVYEESIEQNVPLEFLGVSGQVLSQNMFSDEMKTTLDTAGFRKNLHDAFGPYVSQKLLEAL